MTVADLVKCKNEHDITKTKTCRRVIRKMYRDVTERRKMRFSYMAEPVRKAIRGKYHTGHRESVIILVLLWETISSSF